MKKMTREERVNFVKRWLKWASIAPGLFLLFIYKAATGIPCLSWLSFSLIRGKNVIAPIIAGYAITSLGFILAIVAFSVTLPDGYKVRRYKGWGYYDVYLQMVKIDIICLGFTLLLSILLLSTFKYPKYILYATMVLFVDTLIMNSLAIYILINLMKRE